MYLGIEIGGTKLQLGVGDGEHADLRAQRRFEIDPSARAAGIRQQLQTVVPELLAQFPVSRVGIGFGGPVLAGHAITSHQIVGWDDFPLADWCQDQFGLPTTLGNDCDTAALAEATWGAGQGKSALFYVTVGTGVGGGLVIQGKLHGAGRPAVAEIGHLRPGLQARDAQQTVESLASGWGIVRSATELLAELPSESPDRIAVEKECEGDLSQLTCQQLGPLASSGNLVARQAIATATRALGWAIAQVITLTSAEVIVVGGGVSQLDSSLFLSPLCSEVEVYVFPPLRGTYRIAPAQLGEWVVVHGAIGLAKNSH
jgi:glucokinase